MPTEVEHPWGQINHKLVELKIKHAEKELMENSNRRWAENSLPLTTPGGLTQPEWEALLSNPSRLGDEETVSRLADIWFELLVDKTRMRQRIYREECQRQESTERSDFLRDVLHHSIVPLFALSDKEFEVYYAILGLGEKHDIYMPRAATMMAEIILNFIFLASEDMAPFNVITVNDAESDWHNDILECLAQLPGEGQVKVCGIVLLSASYGEFLAEKVAAFDAAFDPETDPEKLN